MEKKNTNLEKHGYQDSDGFKMFSDHSLRKVEKCGGHWTVFMRWGGWGVPNRLKLLSYHFLALWEHQVGRIKRLVFMPPI